MALWRRKKEQVRRRAGPQGTPAEEIRLFASEVPDKILELYRNKSIRSSDLQDGGHLLATVRTAMSSAELDYVLMATRFYLSNVSSSVTIVVNRA
jgi:hypothetical protein